MYIRSISPIIATILIIVITVAIAGIFYAFTSGMFGSLTQSTSQQIQQQSQMVSFQIVNTYCSNNELYLIIYNSGNIPIDINKAITLISDNQQNTHNTTIMCNNNTIIQPRQQIACKVNNIICYYNPSSNKRYKISFIINGLEYEKYLDFGYKVAQPLLQYRYLRDIIIDNSLNSNSLTDYQISITLDTQSLISNDKMKSDCGDIRFTDFNGTLLNYWIEPNTCNTNNTKIWIKVPFIPGGSTKTIYLWYGNPNATSMSNVNSVFIDIINGLVAAWNFNEGEGNIVYDSSGNGYNLTIYNATWVNGKFGKALYFNGINSYAVAQPFTVYGWNGISICRWVIIPNYKPNSAWSKSFMIGAYWIPDNVSFFQAYPNSTILHGVSMLFTTKRPDGTTGYYGWSVGVLNTWIFICDTFNLTTRVYNGYLNGNLKRSVTIPSDEATILEWNPNTATYPFLYRRFVIGCNTLFTECVNETVSQVMIFNISLTSLEVSELYNNYGYSTPNYPGKVLIKKYTSPEPTIFLGNEVNIQ
jgi:flagellin-like protein